MAYSGRFFPDRLDLHMLRTLAGPLALSLGVLLIAQLLERLLRLLDLAAASGADFSIVIRMAGTLVPHYLGLAVPTAFFAAMFMAIARLSDDSELDVMLSTGRSIARTAVPFFGVAALLCAFNFYLFGYLQPLSRYGYHVAAYEAAQTGWNARLEDNRFVSTDLGFTMGADSVGPDGRQLRKVLVQRRTPAGEEIVTAERGRLVPSADGKRLLLELEHGQIVRDKIEGSVSTLRFVSAQVNGDFTPGPAPYRARGESVRELTLPELWLGVVPSGSAASNITLEKRSGEFHGRLARTFIPPLLPLLALPLGMAAKRGRRAPGVVFAALALLALNQALQFGESMAESGRAAGLPAVWAPVAAFGLVGLWLFAQSLRWPGDNPVSRAVSALEMRFESFSFRRRRRAA